MMTNLVNLASSTAMAALSQLDIDGWLVGPEVRSTVASLLAALFSALANAFYTGFFSG